jgi:hypothetical protein
VLTIKQVGKSKTAILTYTNSGHSIVTINTKHLHIYGGNCFMTIVADSFLRSSINIEFIPMATFIYEDIVLNLSESYSYNIDLCVVFHPGFDKFIASNPLSHLHWSFIVPESTSKQIYFGVEQLRFV